MHKSLNTLSSKSDIVTILKDDSINEALFEAANEARIKYVGENVHLRGLIEISSACSCNCLYCGLRRENSCLERFSLKSDEIFQIAKNAVEKFGLRTLVMQSGENSSFKKEDLANLIEKIKSLGVALTLSLGEKTREEYEAYKNAGADRYLLRIETTDRELYAKMHPGADFDNRLNCIETLFDLGFEVGSGSLVGLPGQSIESIADDIMFFKQKNFDMIGVGPFIAHPNTPLKDVSNGDFTLALKVMSLVRIILKDINIPATTAMETLHKNGRLVALQSGANVVMPNVGEEFFKQKYEIYPNKAGIKGFAEDNFNGIIKKIESINRKISKTHGKRGER